MTVQQMKTVDPSRSIDALVDERRLVDPGFATEWDASAVARAFAITVIRFRVERGLSQEDFAAAIWVDPSIVSLLEDGGAPQ
jgi:ribosome-binding protein aMBF1 (putative translation factor)